MRKVTSVCIAVVFACSTIPNKTNAGAPETEPPSTRTVHLTQFAEVMDIKLNDVVIGESRYTITQIQIEKEAREQAEKLARKPIVKRQIQIGDRYPEVVEATRIATIEAFGEDNWQAMYTLVNKESGFNLNALNKSSGACGLPQALPCSKLADKSMDGQIRWMINYIRARYGTPNNALAFHRAHNWY